MDDVAERAGVSRALVSIVFRGAPGASEPTRVRVREAAVDLGYRPDQRARLLSRSRTGSIGVTFGLRHTFHGDLVEAIYPAAEAAGYDVVLSGVSPMRGDGHAVEALLAYRCEAVICLGPSLPAATLAELAASVPTVVVARRVRAPGVDVVRTDDVLGMRRAVEHLCELGHRRIAHLDGGRAAGAAERRAGFRSGMRAAGLDPSLVVPGGLSETDGMRAVRALLDVDELPTAVAAFNDRSAVGALYALRAAGLRVPDDVSVVGFDDDRLAALPMVDLTTVRQDAAALARLAVSRVVERLAAPLDGRPELPEAIASATLVVRGTTAPAPAAGRLP